MTVCRDEHGVSELGGETKNMKTVDSNTRLEWVEKRLGGMTTYPPPPPEHYAVVAEKRNDAWEFSERSLSELSSKWFPCDPIHRPRLLETLQQTL